VQNDEAKMRKGMHGGGSCRASSWFKWNLGLRVPRVAMIRFRSDSPAWFAESSTRLPSRCFHRCREETGQSRTARAELTKGGKGGILSPGRKRHISAVARSKSTSRVSASFLSSTLMTSWHSHWRSNKICVLICNLIGKLPSDRADNVRALSHLPVLLSFLMFSCSWPFLVLARISEELAAQVVSRWAARV
jgi:hypothetical protein